jgi:hypothetical protein
MKQFFENFLAALRTSGALLVGNAVLVYYGVIGSQRDYAFLIFVIGTCLIILSAIPWTSFKFFKQTGGTK